MNVACEDVKAPASHGLCACSISEALLATLLDINRHDHTKASSLRIIVSSCGVSLQIQAVATSNCKIEIFVKLLLVSIILPFVTAVFRKRFVSLSPIQNHKMLKCSSVSSAASRWMPEMSGMHHSNKPRALFRGIALQNLRQYFAGGAQCTPASSWKVL